MKQVILWVLLMLWVAVLPAGAQQALQEFNRERAAVNKKAFLVLGAWSAANIITGVIGQSASTGQAKYFHQMNIIWGSVNLLVALPGYIGARRSTTDLSLTASLKGQAVTEKTFAFNAGLDLAYMAAGAWTIEKGNSHANSDKYKGYGKSIVMQGAFLLNFDAVMFTTHNRHGKNLLKMLNAVQLAPNSLGLKVAI